MFNMVGGCTRHMLGDSNRLGRRNFLKLSGAATTGAAAVSLAGCLGDDADDVTLRVALWSGGYIEAFDDSLKPMFEEEYGVELETVPNWEEILADIRAAPEDDPPYDVTITDNWFYWAGREEDLFLEVRDENVPQLDEVYPYMRDFTTDEFGVPVDADPMGMVYKEDTGYSLDEWEDLLEDEVENIALEGGFYPYSLLMAAIIYDPDSGGDALYDEENYDAILDILRQMDVSMWYSGGAEMWTGMREGTVNVSQFYHSFAMPEVLSDDGLDVGYAAPSSMVGYSDHYCVVRGTDHRDIAEEFLNFMIREDVQTTWAENYYIAVTNQNASVPEEVSDSLPTSNEEFENVAFPDFTEPAMVDEDLIDAWTELRGE